MMLGNCSYGSMWFGGELWWVGALIVGLIVALVAAALVVVATRRDRPSDPALERLRMRLAAGEISQADFETARRALGA